MTRSESGRGKGIRRGRGRGRKKGTSRRIGRGRGRGTDATLPQPPIEPSTQPYIEPFTQPSTFQAHTDPQLSTPSPLPLKPSTQRSTFRAHTDPQLSTSGPSHLSSDAGTGRGISRGRGRGRGRGTDAALPQPSVEPYTQSDIEPITQPSTFQTCIDPQPSTHGSSHVSSDVGTGRGISKGRRRGTDAALPQPSIEPSMQRSVKPSQPSTFRTHVDPQLSTPGSSHLSPDAGTRRGINRGRGRVTDAALPQTSIEPSTQPSTFRTYVDPQLSTPGSSHRSPDAGTGRGISRGRRRGTDAALPQPSIEPSMQRSIKPSQPSTFLTHIDPQLSMPGLSHLSPDAGNGRGISRGRGTDTALPQPSIEPSTQHSIKPSQLSTFRTHIDPEPSTPGPSHLSTNAASSDGPLGEPSPPAAPSMDIESPDADGRTWIRPGPSNTFDPAVGPPREITRIIKYNFQGVWLSYKEVDANVKQMWYEEFKRLYKWIPEHEMQMKKLFDRQASRSFSTSTYNLRHDKDKGKWISPEIRQQLDEVWNSPQWKEKAQKNVENRRSNEGPVHTGGSIPSTEHMKRLKTSLDADPSCWDLFKRIHTRKGDSSKWVSSKSQRIAVEYQRRIVRKESQQSTSDDVPSRRFDNIFLDVVGGVNKKGRVYGLGQEGGKFKPNSQTSFGGGGVSQSEYEHMRTLVTNLTKENRDLKSRLKSHEEMFRVSQEQSRTFQEQIYQFMNNISRLGRPPILPPAPAPIIDQDNEHNENEIDDDEFDDV